MPTKYYPRKGNSRGPMAQSDEEKKRKGTYQPSRSLAGTVQTDLIEIGEAPEDFTPNQKEHWNIHAVILNELKLVTAADMPLIREFAILGARLTEAAQGISDHGLVYENANGNPAKSPYIEIYNTTFDRYSSICSDFGMSPKGRQRIRAVTMTKEDEIKERSEISVANLLKNKPQI